MDVARGKYSSCLEANAACPAPEFSGSAELILGIDGHLGGRKRTYWAFWLRERCSQERVKRKSLIRPAPHPPRRQRLERDRIQELGRQVAWGSGERGLPRGLLMQGKCKVGWPWEPAWGAQTGRRPGEGMPDGFSGQWEP